MVPKKVPAAAVGFLVDRLHVSTPNSEVVRFIRSKIAYPFRNGRDTRPFRKRVYRAAIKRHAANRRLYITVMRGF